MKEQSFFEELQDQLLDELVKRIESGDATAADLKLAKDYIKEAGIGVYKTHKTIKKIETKFGSASTMVNKVSNIK